MYELTDLTTTNRFVSEDGTQSAESGLDRLFSHYIKEKEGDPIALSSRDAMALFLELLGGSGGIYSWPPAMAYAKNMAPWLVYSFAITNPLSNVLFLIKATDGLFDTIQLETNIPPSLGDLIDEKASTGLVQKYTKMSMGSLICVIPFGISVYLFPLPGCVETWCTSLTVTHSVVSNTILHAVSWGLILAPEYWYYRLPVLPFEKLSSLIKNKCFSASEQLEMLALSRQREAIYQRYKDALSCALKSATDKMVGDYLRHAASSADVLRAIQNDGMTFIQFVELGRSAPIRHAQPVSSWHSVARQTSTFLSDTGVGILGAGVMVVGCIGWIANPYYVALDRLNLDLPEAITIGSLPAYSTAVLCAFYGAAVFKQIFNYMTTCNSIRDKFPFEAQLYPKIFALFLVVNLYVSFFAYATGLQLIATVFEDKMWDDYRPTLENISMPTLQLLSFIPLVELFCIVVRKSVSKFGALDNDDTLAARLLYKMSPISYYLQQMKGDALMKSLLQFTPAQRSTLSLDNSQFEKDIGELNKIQKQIDTLSIERPRPSSWGIKKVTSCIYSIFYSESSGESAPLLPKGQPVKVFPTV